MLRRWPEPTWSRVASAGGASSHGGVVAPMPGRVVAVLAAEGAHVKAGEWQAAAGLTGAGRGGVGRARVGTWAWSTWPCPDQSACVCALSENVAFVCTKCHKHTVALCPHSMSPDGGCACQGAVYTQGLCLLMRSFVVK